MRLCLKDIYQSNVLVHRVDAGAGVLIVQRAAHDLLHRQHDAVFAAQTDQGARLLNRLTGIVDLEDATVRRELRRRQIVLRTKKRLKLLPILYAKHLTTYTCTNGAHLDLMGLIARGRNWAKQNGWWMYSSARTDPAAPNTMNEHKIVFSQLAGYVFV